MLISANADNRLAGGFTNSMGNTLGCAFFHVHLKIYFREYWIIYFVTHSSVNRENIGEWFRLFAHRNFNKCIPLVFTRI